MKDYTFGELLMISGVAWVMGMIVGFGWGHNAALCNGRRDAIAAGVAEWTIDATTGVVEFKYKRPTNERK